MSLNNGDGRLGCEVIITVGFVLEAQVKRILERGADQARHGHGGCLPTRAVVQVGVTIFEMIQLSERNKDSLSFSPKRLG